MLCHSTRALGRILRIALNGSNSNSLLLLRCVGWNWSQVAVARNVAWSLNLVVSVVVRSCSGSRVSWLSYVVVVKVRLVVASDGCDNDWKL